MGRSQGGKVSKQLAIGMRGVVKDYAKTRALSGVDLSVGRGKIHVLLGPNGAGKSTTMRIAAGLIPPDRGEYALLGRNALECPSWVCTKIGFLPEIPPLYDSMRVRAYLDFVQQIHDFTGAPAKALREEVLASCGLESVHARAIGNLSKGFRQRVGIAQALVHRPEVVILDEPSVGLDPQTVVEIRELILGLKERHTVLLSTHNLSEAAKVCDEVSFMREGKIVESGRWEILREKLGPRARLRAQVLKWNREAEVGLSRLPGIGAVACLESRAKGTSLSIAFDGSDRAKSEVGQFLSEHAGLLELRSESAGLEDAFREVAL